MRDLPGTLTYFCSLQTLGQIMQKQALPLVDIDGLHDPFMPNKTAELGFDKSGMFEVAVKYIASAILGNQPPRGQPNHPLIKAIARWRMENRFNDENEVREALQGLLPAMVEKEFDSAQSSFSDWQKYAQGLLMTRFFEKNQSISMWETYGFAHRGVALKFKCEEGSVFEKCHRLNYKKQPPTIVSCSDHVQHMMGIIPEIEFNPENVVLTQNYENRTEKEWRLITSDEEFSEKWLQVPINLLQSVYIGALVGEKHREQISNHLKKFVPKANIYLSKCKHTEYAIEFEKINDEEVIEDTVEAESQN